MISIASNLLNEAFSGLNEQNCTFNFRLMREFLYSYLLTSPIPFDLKNKTRHQPCVTYLRFGKSYAIGSQIVAAVYLPVVEDPEEEGDENLAEKLVHELPPACNLASHSGENLSPHLLHHLLIGLLLGKRTILVGNKTEEAVQSLQYILYPL